MGDLIEQNIEIYKKEIEEWDRIRTRNMATSGLVRIHVFPIYYLHNTSIISRGSFYRLSEYFVISGINFWIQDFPAEVLIW